MPKTNTQWIRYISVYTINYYGYTSLDVMGLITLNLSFESYLPSYV
jgi:hypothetical protein